MVRAPAVEVKDFRVIRRSDLFGSGHRSPGQRFLPPLRLRPPFLRGTFAPARRASLSPIAIACLRLVTFLPERPDLSVPCFRSCIARLTLLCAFFPYFAIGPPMMSIY